MEPSHPPSSPIESRSRVLSANSDPAVPAFNQNPTTHISAPSGMTQNLLEVLNECLNSEISNVPTTSTTDSIPRDVSETTDGPHIAHGLNSTNDTPVNQGLARGPTSHHSLSFMDIPQGNQISASSHATQTCLDRGIKSLGQISSATFLGDAPSTISRTQTILSHNRVALGAVHTIISCSCPKDDYLMVIVSLVMCKVLELYTVAIQPTTSLQNRTESTSHSSTAPNEPEASEAVARKASLEEAYSTRRAAQRVLSELHLVRSPLEELLLALQQQAAQVERGSETGAPENFSIEMFNEQTMPFSASVYDSLALDIAKQLKKLSLDLKDQLKEP